MTYDPTTYAGTARHYLRGRPPYSAELLPVLARETGLDGTGHLLDVGCGPGVLAVALASAFDTVTGLDPDRDMLAEAARHAAALGVDNASWLEARAEQIPDLDLPAMRLVTFGQSFHWTEREVVAEAVFELLQPGGSIVLLAHDLDGHPAPVARPEPPIPHDEIRGIVRRYLGADTRAGQGLSTPNPDKYEDALARTRFGRPRVDHAPGRTDIIRDVDDVVANYLSMSYAAPHLFGDRLDEFVADVRAMLLATSPAGRFWDWPGDTAILIATKPGLVETARSTDKEA